MTPPRAGLVHDVFVSYAHVDDAPPLDLPKGWVTTFVNELDKYLQSKLGWKPAIFMDHQLVAGARFSGLFDAVRSSRTLLLIMSPGYQQSEWCQRELVDFLSNSPTEGIFVVEIEEVERDQWHRALRELKSVTFWERRDRHSRVVEKLGYPRPELHGPYWQRINELAHFLALHLRAQGRTSRPRVWVAEASDDVTSLRDQLVATLRQHQLDPVPSVSYPRHSREAYQEALKVDLESAVALVQLFGRGGSHPTDASADETVMLQARAAGTAATARGVPYLRWRTPQLALDGIPDEAYRAIVTGAEAATIQDFVGSVLRALAVQANEQRDVPSRRASRRETPFIVVKADHVDHALAKEVSKSLEGLGVDVALAPQPHPKLTPARLRQQQETQLHDCDGVVIVYGRTPADWVQSQFALTRRVLAPRRSGVWGALVDGPPDPKPDAGVGGPSLLLLECRRGVDAGKLRTFLSSLQR